MIGVSAARIAFAAIGGAALLLLTGVLRPSVGTVMPVFIFGTAAVSIWRPALGVLVLVGLGPVTNVLSVLTQADKTGIHFTEALVLAFIGGACLRRAADPAPVAAPRYVVWPAVLLIAAALASAIVQEPAIAAEQQPVLGAWAYARVFLRDYFVLHNNLTFAIELVEGLLLVILAADLFARDPLRRPAAMRMLIAGAAGAAALNVVRLLMAALRQPDALQALATFAVNARISVQYSDWNAAGSYFAMVLVVTAVFALRQRFAYAAPAMLIAAGLWLTGSRTAIAAVLFVGLIAAAVRLRPTSPRRASLLAVVIGLIGIAAVAGWRYYPASRNDSVFFSWTTRVPLWKAGVRMMATDPLFGVGVGRFYDLSPSYAAPTLAVIWRSRENAHNNFVQTLAELGVPGLIFFGFVVGGAWLAGARAARRDADWSLPAALGTFLLTCLTGHPLLVLEAAFPFWTVVGIAAGQDTRPARPGRRWPALAAACVVAAYAISVPPRAMTALKNANRQNTTVGLSPWQREGDKRFRWADSRSSFYYPASGRAIRIPLRRGPDAPSDVVVRIYFDGREADRVRLQADEDWRIVRIVRPHHGSDAAFFRIDLVVVSAGTLEPVPGAPRMLMVGQPAIVWDE
jgi:O-antigen ligase